MVRGVLWSICPVFSFVCFPIWDHSSTCILFCSILQWCRCQGPLLPPPPTIPLSLSPPSLPPCCNASRNPASSPISRSEIKSKQQGDSQSRPMMTRPMLIKISPGLRKRTKLLVPDYRCVDSDNNLALALLSSTIWASYALLAKFTSS